MSQCAVKQHLKPLHSGTYSQGYVIKIGQNVYIGAGVTIAPSEHSMRMNKSELTIGDNAYIVPGTVVTAVSLIGMSHLWHPS